MCKINVEMYIDKHKDKVGGAGNLTTTVSQIQIIIQSRVFFIGLKTCLEVIFNISMVTITMTHPSIA